MWGADFRDLRDLRPHQTSLLRPQTSDLRAAVALAERQSPDHLLQVLPLSSIPFMLQA